jgi:phage repressor protein C with HTH and peptisase S24 domain
MARMLELETPLQAALRTALEKTGRNAREVSLAAGLSDSAIKNILQGKSKSPRLETVHALEKVLGVDLAGAVEKVTDPNDAFFDTNVVADPTIPPPQPRRPRDYDLVPVMGTAEAGDDGFFEINLTEGPVEQIERPAALRHLEQGELFAIRVHGESMDPVWEAGDPVYIVKSWPLKHRGFVVATIEMGKGHHPRALLKQYLSRNDNQVHLRQFNPPKEVDLPRKQVKEMWRALHWRELQDK